MSHMVSQVTLLLIKAWAYARVVMLQVEGPKARTKRQWWETVAVRVQVPGC